MSNTNILEGYAEVELIAADFKKHPRTIRRWMAQEEDGLPYTKIGNRPYIHIEIFISKPLANGFSAECASVIRQSGRRHGRWTTK